MEVSVIVRGQERANVLQEHGVKPYLIGSLDDTEAVTKAASEHDIVFNTASGFHTNGARALIIGLGQRKKVTGKEVYYFHTTGTSNIGDKPITKDYYEPRILSDKDDLYTYLKGREAKEVYAQRTTDIVSIETGLEHGVKTYLIMSPTIYGTGTGLFNRTSSQLPSLIRTAIKHGKVDLLGDGTGVWDQIHISDLVTLYELLLARVLANENIPSGKEGIYFSEAGDFTWRELSEGLAAELYKQGVLPTAEVNSLPLQEFADLYSGGDAQYSELGFASNSRSRAELSRELGWKPARTRGDFKKSFAEEVSWIVAQLKK